MDIKDLKRHYDIIGNDPKYLMALNKAVQVAPTDLSILITGESGVGKDVFSRIIHDGSLRKSGRLISVNCGAIPSGTIESELFGHLAGSFTGAEKNRKGYFEEADGGTIFLDEVGELPAPIQVKLLRVLQNGEIIPVGSSVPRKVDVRIVAATNVNLLEAIRTGRFREDLYYRLNQITITIPPLRERREDIPLLFRKFTTDIAEQYKMLPLTLTDSAKQFMMEYPWHGNVRELKNVTDQISVLESSRLIDKEILKNYLVEPEPQLPVLFNGEGDTGRPITDRELLLKALNMGQMITDMRKELNQLRQVVSQMAQGVPINQSIAMDSDDSYGSDASISLLPQSTHQRGSVIDVTNDYVHAQPIDIDVELPTLAREDREKEDIEKALKRSGGKRKAAAEMLHISERTLYRKIKEYGL